MGNLFRKQKKKESRIQEIDVKIAELKVTRDKLRTYQKKLESNISSLKAGISNCIALKKKDAALLMLRKQKFIEKNLQSTFGELLNIDTIINSIETAQMQAKVVQALSAGNEILKKMNKELTIEDVDKLMAETDEAIEYQHEVGLALSNQGINENDDLLEELDRLEVDDYKIPSVPNRPVRQEKPEYEIPSVPDRPIVEEKKNNKKQKVIL